VPEGDASHVATPDTTPRGRGGRWLRRVTAGLVVLVLLAAGTTYQFDLGNRWFGFDYPSPVTEPAKVAPPPGLTLPKVPSAAAVVCPIETNAEEFSCAAIISTVDPGAAVPI